VGSRGGRGRGGKAGGASSTQVGGDEIINSISDSQMRKQIAQKLGGGGKRRRPARDIFNGKTEEELREEQRRLFENANNYVDEYEEGSENPDYGYYQG
jgi:hypothetical protein